MLSKSDFRSESHIKLKEGDGVTEALGIASTVQVHQRLGVEAACEAIPSALLLVLLLFDLANLYEVVNISVHAKSHVEQCYLVQKWVFQYIISAPINEYYIVFCEVAHSVTVALRGRFTMGFNRLEGLS